MADGHARILRSGLGLGLGLGLVLGLVLLAGCAHVEAPPGGPEDRTPPLLLATEPAEGAIVSPFAGPVRFLFDERISERGLDDAVIVSPQTGPVSVDHRRSELRVGMREGWAPNTIYQLWVAPTIRDLFGNVVTQPIRLVFSTGPQLPATEVDIFALDRLTGRPALDLRVEAIRLPDSLVYFVPPDSAGHYRVDRIPEGSYLFRAFEDLNRNRVLDPTEARDSVRAEVRAGTPLELDLSPVAPDSTPPVARTARLQQGRIELEFDDYLDPDQTISPDQITLTTAAGAVPFARAAVGALPQLTPDSILPPDTTSAARPRLPSRVLVIEPSADLVLEPGSEVEVSAERIRNLVGLEGGGVATFTIPGPP